MSLNDILNQYRVAVVGHPDSGKSTFIATLIENVTGKKISTDTLMKEVHWSDGRDPMGNPDTRTIKCAKVMFQHNGLEYCMYDCPGHMEYIDQIKQGICDSDIIICINDLSNKKDSDVYIENIKHLIKGKPALNLYSHSETTDTSSAVYNAFDNAPAIHDFMSVQMTRIESTCRMHRSPHDILEEAISLAKECIDPSKKNILLYSGGKDSVVGLFILHKANLLNSVKVMFPSSGYDFSAIYKTNDEVSKYFNIAIQSFDNALGLRYGVASNYDMMQAKARANDLLVQEEKPEMLIIQFRASDEGVRSKDYHISDRITHKRFSPVFYFSETNIWRTIKKFNLPVNKLYFEGYRSLGDEPVTSPCMPHMDVDEIINYIDTNPNTSERDGRKKQDSSTDFAMEKLRNIGFF